MSVKRSDGMRSKTLNKASLESTEPHLVHQLVSQREADDFQSKCKAYIIVSNISKYQTIERRFKRSR